MATQDKCDPDFGRKVDWDIPFLEGYEYTFVDNISQSPGSHHFKGIDNPALINEIDSWNPDTLLVFGWAFKSHLMVLRHCKGKKMLLFRGDSHLLDEVSDFSATKILRNLFLKWIYSHVDKALYVGKANKLYFRKAGMKEHQLIFAPHAVDNERFGERVNGIRSHLDIPEESIVFLFSGKLEEKKNPHLLLEAFLRLNSSSAHVIFAGSGNLEESLKNQVFELKGEQQRQIHFVGFQNQSAMPAIYQSSDVFVLPSQGPGETWGLAVNEAMAAGCAVLVSDKCGCHEDLVRNGINGFVFKSKDVEELTFFMKQLIEDKKKLSMMGEASKEIVRAYSFDKICDAIEEAMA